jgi:linoleoyl-CoA desaturase
LKDARIRFDSRTQLGAELRRRVDAYFEQPGRRPRDLARMYRKSAVLVGWWLASYLAFVIARPGWLVSMLLAGSMGLAMAGIGMSVQHDGGHRAYSDRKWVNRLSAAMLDVLGSSSYIWHFKHNVMHHTYTNVVGADDDLDLGWLARLAPGNPRRRLHRWQHLYLWPLYAFITFKWHWVDDFRQLAAARLGDHEFPRPRGWDRVQFWAGKAVFFGWAVVVPLLVMPVGQAIAFYFVSQLVLGFVLSATFQCAHVDEEATSLAPAPDASLQLDFARHQLSTTIDFATGNRLATWYLGGLNFQAVHHLFPRVCHLHYPALSRIVAEVCAEHGVTYRPTPTVRAALRSHFRQLRALGAA